jgi:predicted signal transduction protein with EAL and GGDEF domain
MVFPPRMCWGLLWLPGSCGLRRVLWLVDLDGFKAANDGHVHLFGDDVLKRVAEEVVAEPLCYRGFSAGPGDAVAWV